jgi:TPR repeat protein
LAAQQGKIAAQYRLGYLYRYGLGVDANYDQARRWLTLAARQNHAAARSELEQMDQQGQGLNSEPD